jgi:hypothetical protein
MKKYEHMLSLNFTMTSDNEEPTKDELLQAFRGFIKSMSDRELANAIELYDSEDLEGEDDEDDDEN